MQNTGHGFRGILETIICRWSVSHSFLCLALSDWDNGPHNTAGVKRAYGPAKALKCLHCSTLITTIDGLKIYYYRSSADLTLYSASRP